MKIEIAPRIPSTLAALAGIALSALIAQTLAPSRAHAMHGIGLVGHPPPSPPGVSVSKMDQGPMRGVGISQPLAPTVHEGPEDLAMSPDLEPYGGAASLSLGMHGEGEGRWRGPDAGIGRLRATLVATPDGSQFLLDASLARMVPIGEQDPTVIGGLWGELYALSPTDPPVSVAFVSGLWEQDPADGQGEFLAEILVSTGDAIQPLATIGFVGGRFATAPPDSGLPQSGGVELRWRILD